MKTLNELNKKIWYRLLKVLYILIFIGMLFLTIILNYNNLKYDLVRNEKIFIKKSNIKKYMKKDIFFTKVKNAIDSGDFEGQNDDEIYNGFLESATLGGISVIGLEEEQKNMMNLLMLMLNHLQG